MSIRESFQENPPGEKDLNIHGIAIEKKEEREKLPFNLTEQDWREMSDKLRELRQVSYLQDFCEQAAAMKIIFPERIDELDLNDGVWQKIKNDLERFEEDYLKSLDHHENDEKTGAQKMNEEYQDFFWESFPDYLIAIKILFPDKISELKLGEGERDLITAVPYKLENSLGNNNRINFYRFALMQVFFPKEAGEFTWECQDDDILILKDFRGDWRLFAELAMKKRIIFPDKNGGFNQDKEAWQGMEKELKNLRQQKNWQEFSRQVMAMTILAAKEVEVTEEGLRVIAPPRESFKEPKTKRPERRQF